MNQRLRRWMYALCICLSLLGIARLYYRLTDDFRLANMTYQLPFEAPWQVPSLSSTEYQHLAQLFEQKFTYMGKGAQCYAFESEDGQHVLKFFKFKHLKPNWCVEYLPSLPLLREYKQSCIERKKRKLMSVFNGYDLAFRENRQASKLIYVHLVPTQHLKLKARVRDKLGLEHVISLDDVVFLVQSKGETLRTRLYQLLDQQYIQEAKQALAKILEMYIAEYQKGIYDQDHGILHNTGFIENYPFHLDVGKLNRDERMKEIEFYKEDLKHVIWKMDTWIKTYYPQYSVEFSQFLAQQYQRWTREPLDLQTIDFKQFKKKRKFFGLLK